MVYTHTKKPTLLPGAGSPTQLRRKGRALLKAGTERGFHRGHAIPALSRREAVHLFSSYGTPAKGLEWPSPHIPTAHLQTVCTVAGNAC